MSIATAITAAQGRVADCYTAISTKGGTLPATQNLSNMPTAINSIPTGSSPTLITKNITANGTYNASSDNADGYSSVTVNVSGGSKYGCTIDNLLGDVDANGVLQLPTNTSGDMVFTDVKDTTNHALYYRFSRTYMNRGVEFPDLEEVSGINSLYYSFADNFITSISFPKLKTVSGLNGMLGTFASNSNPLLTSVSFPELETVSGNSGIRSLFQTNIFLTSISLPKLKTVTGTQGLYQMLASTKISTLSLPELTTINAVQAMNFMCQSCSLLETVSMPKLSDISGQSTLGACFFGCPKLQHIYFDGLTTTSFGSYINQFNNMFNTTTGSTATGGCTVHFPSNMQSTIAGLQGYPTFGGSANYINLAFDLPATS